MLSMNRIIEALQDLEGTASKLFDRLATHFGRDEELSLLFMRLGIDAASHTSILRHMGQFMRQDRAAAANASDGNGDRFHMLRKDLERLREQSSDFEGLDAVRAVLEIERFLMESYAEDILSTCPAGLANMVSHMHSDCRNQIKELQGITRRRSLPRRSPTFHPLRALFGAAGR
jgi:hypothetical protein